MGIFALVAALASLVAGKQASAAYFEREQLGPGTETYTTSVADYDLDGHGDVAGCWIHSVRVLAGNGVGGFALSGEIRFAELCYDTVASDLVGDTRSELIAGISDHSGNTSILILKQDELGGLVELARLPTSGLPSSMAAGDFNGDGANDLAITEYRSTVVRIQSGDGHGGFASEKTVDLGGPIFGLAQANLNDDELDDLAVTRPGTREVVGLIGSDSERPVEAFATEFNRVPRHVAAGDLGGDASDELAVTSGRKTVIVKVNRNGEFTKGQRVLGEKSSPSRGVWIEDLDSDGRRDLVSAFDWGIYTYPGTTRGLDAPTIHASIRFAARGRYWTVTDLGFADFDHDGDVDLAGSNETLELFRQTTSNVACKRTAANVIGSKYEDGFLYEAPAPSVVQAGPGDDKGRSTARNDLVCAGKGADNFEAQRGQDRLYGGPGRDGVLPNRPGEFEGGPGNDFIAGGPGADRLGAGRYSIEPGADVLVGGPGNDVLRAGPGQDVLRGGGGHDICIGGAGRDVFRGCEVKR